MKFASSLGALSKLSQTSGDKWEMKIVYSLFGTDQSSIAWVTDFQRGSLGEKIGEETFSSLFLSNIEVQSLRCATCSHTRSPVLHECYSILWIPFLTFSVSKVKLHALFCVTKTTQLGRQGKTFWLAAICNTIGTGIIQTNLYLKIEHLESKVW